MGRYLFLLIGAILISPAQAQSMKEIEKREAELVAAWEAAPLAFRKAVFVTEKAPLYGKYTLRPNNVFKKGESLLIYMEPVGYAWRQDGEYQNFGIRLDVNLQSKEGKILGGQKDFLVYNESSRRKIRELMLNVTLSLGGTPPGEYSAEITGRDLEGKTTSTSFKFIIAK